ncbi:YwqI/YxiC family protein [Metabacillus sp. KIGAM252]|uniref:YwqI/YxiC family protein n=1 Tax=Metabacillus flavus TaxID=2823519 RepID=A0ABS5LB10_9BACI|nr:YwqI/YxiC family protein [Metabacillus flavus]MBS2967914.1 YwqI/YxiC family protein [Metabacillus flavus]
MTDIKLDHAEVMKQLADMKKALSEIKIDSPSAESLGENDLKFTKVWLEKEEQIHTFADEYVKAVLKNIEDTEDNVNYLREQDEAITMK